MTQNIDLSEIGASGLPCAEPQAAVKIPMPSSAKSSASSVPSTPTAAITTTAMRSTSPRSTVAGANKPSSPSTLALVRTSQDNNRRSRAPGVYTDTTNGAAGQGFYDYQVYLEKGKYLSFTIADVKTGQMIGKRDYGPPGIPSKPLNFFMGEYNCAASGSDSTNYCGGPYNGNSFMEIGSILYRTCD